MMRAALILACGLLNWSLMGPALASEIDSFTGRYETIQQLDQTSPSPVEVLDEITQKKMLAAIEEANQKGQGCNVNALHGVVKKHLSGPKFLDVEAVYGVLEGVVDVGRSPESTHSIARLEGKKSQSVYRDFSLTQAPMLYTHVSSTFAVNHPKYGKLLIGSDKLGHFFGQGYSYHIRAKQYGLAQALAWGDRSEKGNMGWTTTGIYSYGDLAANYEGMKFWDRLVSQSAGQEPYVLCQNGKWQKNPKTQFSWLDYLNPAMDEGLNCSTYRNQNLIDKVHKRQLQLERENPGQVYTCPVQTAPCAQMVEYARKEAKRLRRNGGLPHGQGVELVDHLVAPECRQLASKKPSERKKYTRPTLEEIQGRECQEGMLSNWGKTCARTCSHYGALGGYFVKSMWDLWHTDNAGIIRNYQKAIDEVQSQINGH